MSEDQFIGGKENYRYYPPRELNLGNDVSGRCTVAASGTTALGVVSVNSI